MSVVALNQTLSIAMVTEKLKQFVNYTTIQTGVHIAVTGVMWAGLGLMAISGTVGLIRRRRKTK